MNGFLLFVIAVTLIYIAYKMPKKENIQREEDAASKQERMVARQLTTLRARPAEAGHGGNTFVTFEAQVLDSDDEWVLLLVPGRKQDERRVVRISQIREVRELA